MRGVILIFLLDFVAQAHGKGPATAANRFSDKAQDRVMDNWIDGFFDRTLPAFHTAVAGLDNATVGKAGSVALKPSSRSHGLQAMRSPRVQASFNPSRLAPRLSSHLISSGSPNLKGLRLPGLAGATAIVPAARSQRMRSLVVPRAASDSQDLYIENDGFDISKISFGSILVAVGGSFLVYGFGSYVNLLPGADLGGVLLIYGVPASLLGAALRYAELKPLECKTTKAAFALRDSQMTAIQKQVREDVTRYRYGDEQHLDLALERIFKIGRPDGITRAQCPRLVSIKEETRDGMYALVLDFENKKSMNVTKWEGKNEKFQSFFGPGISAVTQATDKGKSIALISDGSGQGMKGEDKEVLPPLMPGLAPRVVEKDAAP
jgi:hypothetical protein